MDTKMTLAGIPPKSLVSLVRLRSMLAGREIDFVDQRCGQDGQSVGPRVEARPQNHRGIDPRVGGLQLLVDVAHAAQHARPRAGDLLSVAPIRRRRRGRHFAAMTATFPRAGNIW
jgi:hypothetical protein